MACVNTVVRVKQGNLRGVIEDGVYGDRYLAFRGIPYAKPPVGPLRFKDPEPPEPWNDVRDASKFGDSCAQFEVFSRQLIGSDDCLYLNVYIPVTETSKKRSVMVWIHGGAFVHGSAMDNIYGADYLIRKDIVLVTINYRLGVLGFLNLENEMATGNQGLKDQLMALKWVQENISSFGGDPNNVTLFGESAGSASVHYLTLSPMSQAGLFNKAIMQSGVATNPWAIITIEPSKYAFMLAAKLGQQTTDPKTVLEFLRTIDARTLAGTASQILTPQQRYAQFGAFAPGIDDKSPNPVIPQHPSILMKAGVQLPCLLGFNENEGSLFLNLFRGHNNEDSSLPNLNTNFEMAISPEMLLFLNKEGICPKDVKRLYFGDKTINQETSQNFADFMSDAMFLQGIYNVVNMQAEKSAHPTYLYKFTYDSEDCLTKLALNVTLPGATHAEELQYLFFAKMLKLFNVPPPEVGSEKYKVMEYLTQMWTDFAKTENPTPKTTELITTFWKPLEKSNTYNYLNIGKTLKMETSSKDRQRFDWKKLKNKL